MSEYVEIQARVERFIPNAMTDHLAGGRWATYDASELRVLSPEGRAGTRLFVYHDRPPEPGSVWRRPKQRIRFRVAKRDLDPGVTLFDGALTDLAVVDGAPEG